MKKAYVHTWALVLVVLLLMVQATSCTAEAQEAPPPPPPTPGSGVEPGSGTVGTTFTFFFERGDSEWPVDEPIEYWVIGPGSQEPFERGQFVNQPDGNGRTTWTWTAPAGVWDGTWSMNARLYDPDSESQSTVHIPFILSNVPAPIINSGVDPARGTAGTRFDFFSDAWPRGDIVDYWVLPPGWTEPFDRGKIYGDPDGITNWHWVAPEDIWAGTWTMGAYGHYSELEVRITFELEGPPPPPPPSASVDVDEALPGETLTFRASGFKGGEELAYWVSAPYAATPVARSGDDELYANADGEAIWAWTVPFDAQPGIWSMVVLGKSNYLEHQILFSVLEPGSAAYESDVWVEPEIGPPGTTFYFMGRNFKPEEPLGYWVTTPEGETISDNRGIYADKEGDIALEWPTSPEDSGGHWMMTIQGKNSLKMVTVDFEIIGPSADDPGLPYRVSPEAGPPGTTFNFFAQGFQQLEQVGWWATSPAGQVYKGGVDVRATKNGQLEWSWTVPISVTAGIWTMTVEGKQSNMYYNIPFTVTESGPEPAPPYSVTPDSGPPGTTFHFEAVGLVPGEQVGYWANSPDNRNYAGKQELNANSEGRLTWTWTAPDDALAGSWRMVIESSPSDDELANTRIVIPFTIAAP